MRYIIIILLFWTNFVQSQTAKMIPVNEPSISTNLPIWKTSAITITEIKIENSGIFEISGTVELFNADGEYVSDIVSGTAGAESTFTSEVLSVEIPENYSIGWKTTAQAGMIPCIYLILTY